MQSESLRDLPPSFFLDYDNPNGRQRGYWKNGLHLSTCWVDVLEWFKVFDELNDYDYRPSKYIGNLQLNYPSWES